MRVRVRVRVEIRIRVEMRVRVRIRKGRRRGMMERWRGSMMTKQLLGNGKCRGGGMME